MHFQERQFCQNDIASLLKRGLLYKKSICSLWEQILSLQTSFQKDVGLEFNGPVNTIMVMSSWSVYLTTLRAGLVL